MTFRTLHIPSFLLRLCKRIAIKEGKLADITVFDHNLLEIPEDKILKIEVVLTIIDGKIVFERK